MLQKQWGFIRKKNIQWVWLIDTHSTYKSLSKFWEEVMEYGNADTR